MSSSFDFTGFDGISHTVPSLPEELNNYKHFIFFNVPNSDFYLILGFNTNSFRMRLSDSRSYMYLIFNEKTEIFNCILNPNYGNKWSAKIENVINFSQSGDFNVVYLSDSLLNFKDTIITREFQLDIPEVPVLTYTLRPIIEEQKISSSNVFLEIFDVFPILLVVLIGFIGIRKGIDFLFNLLRNS